jgi:hypothetical protein
MSNFFDWCRRHLFHVVLVIVGYMIHLTIEGAIVAYGAHVLGVI